MKALVFDGKPGLREIPQPVPEKGEALIKVGLAGICSTDIEIMRGYMGFRGVMGHEFAGEVAQSEDSQWIGKRVVGEINLACGSCSFCRKGLARHCPNRTVLGILEKDGALAEYMTLPLENLHEVPDSVSEEAAVFVEPLAAALEILEQVEVKPEDRVVVLGDGKLGLLVAMVMSLHASNLTAVGKHEDKLAILDSLGIETSLVSDAGSRFASPDDRPDIIVEATGNQEGLGQALEWIRPCGTVVLKSTFAEKATLDLSPVVINEINLIGSRCGPFDKAIALLEKNKVDPGPLITAEYPLSDAEAAIAKAMEKGTLKVLLRC